MFGQGRVGVSTFLTSARRYGTVARHRRLISVQGSSSETERIADALLSRCKPGDVFWVDCASHISRAETKRNLGRSFDAVVINVHEAFDPDVISRCQGFVWGGGSLIFRSEPLTSTSRLPLRLNDRIAAFPFTVTDVTANLWHRICTHLLHPAENGKKILAETGPLPPAVHDVTGTDQQREVVDKIHKALSQQDDQPSVIALVAGRGRGKSSAVGMALTRLVRSANNNKNKKPLRIAVTGGSESSPREVFRFSDAIDVKDHIQFIPAVELAQSGTTPYDVVVVDEAAQLSVPVLQRITQKHTQAHLIFATTTYGYEGTGRGFVLRFLEWLDRHNGRTENVMKLTMTQPIRWTIGDPVEAAVLRTLCLDSKLLSDAATRQISVVKPEFVLSKRDVNDATTMFEVDRFKLSTDDQFLSDFFGLLTHAHYRTTPGDLHRLLDAPNLSSYAVTIPRCRNRVIAAGLIAREGGFSQEVAKDRGSSSGNRFLGHALPDTLATHSGRSDAAMMNHLRNVRLAVHPEFRRLGLGLKLLQHMGATELQRRGTNDIVGSIFGATPFLVQFHYRLGYSLCRLGGSRGARTGEPAVVLLKSQSPLGDRLIQSLRQRLRQELELQLELLEADSEIPIDEKLRQVLRDGLAVPTEETVRDYLEDVEQYVSGARTYESAAAALTLFFQSFKHGIPHAVLDAKTARILQDRVGDRRGWPAVAGRANVPVPSAMRSVRFGFKQLLEFRKEFIVG